MDCADAERHNWRRPKPLSRLYDDELSICTDDAPLSPCSSTSLSFFSTHSEDPFHSAPAANTSQSEFSCHNASRSNPRSPHFVQSSPGTAHASAVNDGGARPIPGDFVEPGSRGTDDNPSAFSHSTACHDINSKSTLVPVMRFVGFSPKPTDADFVIPTNSNPTCSLRQQQQQQQLKQQHVSVSSLPGIVLRPKRSPVESSTSCHQTHGSRKTAALSRGEPAVSAAQRKSAATASRGYAYSQPLDVRPPCADDFVQTPHGNLSAASPDFVLSQSQSTDALHVIACQPDLQVLLSGAVKSSALLRNNPDFIPPAVSPVHTARARRRSLPEKRVRDDRMQRFLEQRKVIQMNPDSDGRCTHTEVAPSSMMTLAMELLVSPDNRASSLFKQAKKKADDEAAERESILPNLWVVPKDESETIETTASHLKPCIKATQDRRKDTKDPQNKPTNTEILPEKAQEIQKTFANSAAVAPSSIVRQPGQAETRTSHKEIREDDVVKDLMTLTVADLVGSPDTVYSDTESEFEPEISTSGAKLSTGAIYIDSPTICTTDRNEPKNRTEKESVAKREAVHEVDKLADIGSKPNALSTGEENNKVTNDMFSRANRGRLQPGAHPKSCLSDSDVQPCESAWSGENSKGMETHANSDYSVDICGIIPCSSPSTASVLSNSSSLTTVSSLSLSSSSSSPSSPPSTDTVTADVASPHSSTIVNHIEHVDYVPYPLKADPKMDTPNSNFTAGTESSAANHPAGGMSSMLAKESITSTGKHRRNEWVNKATNSELHSVAGNGDESQGADIRPAPDDNALDQSSQPGHGHGSSVPPKVPIRRQSFHRMKKLRLYRRQISDPTTTDIKGSTQSPEIDQSIRGADRLIRPQRAGMPNDGTVYSRDKLSSSVVCHPDKNEACLSLSAGEDNGNMTTPPASPYQRHTVASTIRHGLAQRDNKEVPIGMKYEDKQNNEPCIRPSELICSKGHLGGTNARRASAIRRSQDNPSGNTVERVPSHSEVIRDAYYVIGNLDTNKRRQAGHAEEIPTLCDSSFKSCSEGMHFGGGDSISRETTEDMEQPRTMSCGTTITNNGVTVKDGSKVSLVGTPNAESHFEPGFNEQSRVATKAIYMDDLLSPKRTEAGYSNAFANPNIEKDTVQREHVQEELIMPSFASSSHSGQYASKVTSCNAYDSGNLRHAYSRTGGSKDALSFNAHARPFVGPVTSSQPGLPGLVNQPANHMTPSGQYMQVGFIHRESEDRVKADDIRAKKTPFDRTGAMGNEKSHNDPVVEKSTHRTLGQAATWSKTNETEMDRRAKVIEMAQHNSRTTSEKPSCSKYIHEDQIWPASSAASRIDSRHGYSLGQVRLSHSPSPQERNNTGSNTEIYSSCVKITLNPQKAAENMKRGRVSPAECRPSSTSGCSMYSGGEFRRNNMDAMAGSKIQGSDTFPRGNRSHVSNKGVMRKEEMKVREVVIPEKKVHENAEFGSTGNPELPAHSTEDESDFAGVVDGPCKNVKEIRAMFKKGPDYANYAKPKLVPRKPSAPRTKSKKEEIFGHSVKQSPTNEVAQQIIGLFKGALTIDVDETEIQTRPDNLPVKNIEANNNEPTISVKEKVASFNSGKSAIVESGSPTEKEMQETLKLSTFAPYAEIISNPAPKAHTKPALQPEKVKAESYDESLDQFYDILDELTAT